MFTYFIWNITTAFTCHSLSPYLNLSYIKLQSGPSIRHHAKTHSTDPPKRSQEIPYLWHSTDNNARKHTQTQANNFGFSQHMMNILRNNTEAIGKRHCLSICPLVQEKEYVTCRQSTEKARDSWNRNQEIFFFNNKQV